MERLHQFTELDSHQMELLEKTVTTETGCNDKVEVRQPAFLTQLSPVGNKMNSQKIATSTHPRHKLSKSDAYEDTENSQTAENDLKLLYDYDGYFKQMQRKNEEVCTFSSRLLSTMIVINCILLYRERPGKRRNAFSRKIGFCSY